MAKLDGKIALISGGTSGIGAETAKLFQSEGATVVVTGSNERSVEAAKLVLPGIEVLLSDAGNVAATKTLVDQVKTKHGRIDVLFVNAGIAKFMPIAQVDEAFYDSQFNINVKGAFFLIKHAIPVIPDGGAIILTASVAGANGGLAGSSIYGSTKAALRSFGRTIAKRRAASGSIPSAPARSSPRSSTKADSHRLRRTTSSRGPRPEFRSAAPAPPPKSPQRPSTLPQMRPTPPAPNCSSTAA
jgi:NAD(P)-dependent dehydrogenase (short-subunit alcohol dehydrogenase family)